MGNDQVSSLSNWLILVTSPQVSLQNAAGHCISDPDLVAKKFKDFYQELYSSTVHYSQDDLSSFQQNVQFPSLPPFQVTQLEAPITTNDIEEAMAHLAPSKAPGSDRLSLRVLYSISRGYGS